MRSFEYSVYMTAAAIATNESGLPGFSLPLAGFNNIDRAIKYCHDNPDNLNYLAIYQAGKLVKAIKPRKGGK